MVEEASRKMVALLREPSLLYDAWQSPKRPFL
jgi:hypothetical protein